MKKKKKQLTANQIAYSYVFDVFRKNTYEPKISCLFLSSIKVMLNGPK